MQIKQLINFGLKTKMTVQYIRPNV